MRADRALTEDSTARAEAQMGHPGGGGPSHSAKPTSAQSRQVGGRRTGRDGRTACFAVSWDVVMAIWCQAGHRPREGDPEQAYTSQYLPGQRSSHPPGAAAGQCQPPLGVTALPSTAPDLPPGLSWASLHPTLAILCGALLPPWTPSPVFCPSRPPPGEAGMPSQLKASCWGTWESLLDGSPAHAAPGAEPPLTGQPGTHRAVDSGSL